MLLNAKLVLTAMSPDPMAHLHVINVDQVIMLALARPLVMLALLELSLLMVEPTTVPFAPLDLSPNLPALTAVINALLATMSKTEPLVITALLVPSHLLKVLLTSLTARLVPLELSPETLDPLHAPNVLLVAMQLTLLM